MYYVVYGLLWLFSLLPLRILYFLADVIFMLVFHVFRYRLKVVMKNLDIAFPEKSKVEKKTIARKFYHDLIDTFIEAIKMMSASPAFLNKRVKGNWELINRLKEPGRNVQIHLGHNFNWEWANAAAARNLKIPFVVVYMPIENKIFERLFYSLRSRHGSRLIRATHMREDFLPYRNQQYILCLAADQNPGVPAKALWFNFFGRPTPFVKGPAKNAIANDAIVVFASISKTRRGYYDVILSLAEENPSADNEKELTRKFVTYLEDVIRQYPDMWLWSHRRWKHEWKEGYGEVTG